MDWLELTIDFIEAGIYLLFLARILPRKKNTGNKTFLCLIIVAILAEGLITVVTSSEGLLQFGFLNVEYLVNAARFYVAAELLFGGKHFEKVTAALLAEGISIITGLMTATLLPVILSTEVGNLLQQDGSEVRYAALIFAKTLHLLLCLAVSGIIRFLNIKAGERNWLLSSVMLGVSFLGTGFAMTIIRTDNDSVKNVMLILLIVVLLSESVIVFYLFLIRMRDAVDEQRLQYHIEKATEELGNLEERQKYVDELRSLRHEIRNEYVPVREMIKHKEFDLAEKKLTELIKDSEEELKRDMIYETGNVSIDLVLNYYLSVLRAKGVFVRCSVRKVDLNSEKEKDVCSILINMLKNMCEALEKNGRKKAEISIEPFGDYLVIAAKNQVDKSVLENNPMLKTSKEDKENHGYGIRAIKRLAVKNDGDISIKESNGYFECKAAVLIYTKTYRLRSDDIK